MGQGLGGGHCRCLRINCWLKSVVLQTWVTKTPASSGHCFFSLPLAAVVSDQLNGLETLWGLPSLLFNIKLLCKTLLWIFFGKKTVQDASLKSMVQTPFDLRGNETTPNAPFLCILSQLWLLTTTCFCFFYSGKAGELQIHTNSINCKMWKNKWNCLFSVLQKSE